MSVYNQILTLLDSHQVSYKTFDHQPVVTSVQAAEVRGTDIAKGAKSLVFMADNKPIILVLGGDKKVAIKQVKATLGIKDLRMATPTQVFDLTGVHVGGVPPIGSIFTMPTYLDEAFLTNDAMDFNAGDRAKSIEMALSDFIKAVAPTLMVLSS